MRMRAALAACLFSMVGIGCSDSEGEKKDTAAKTNTVTESGTPSETGTAPETGAATETVDLTATETVAEADAANGSTEPRILKVGDAAPEFTLQDQNDEAVNFADIIGKRKATAFVFYRSADW